MGLMKPAVYGGDIWLKPDEFTRYPLAKANGNEEPMALPHHYGKK